MTYFNGPKGNRIHSESLSICYACYQQFLTLINNLITAPLFLLSIINNINFLFDQEVGEMYMERAFKSWNWGTPIVLLFLYCGSQVSIETKNWEISKELAKLSNKKID